jgi:hypothetical protein
MFRVGIRPPAIRQRTIRMGKLQHRRVLKQRARLERLALADAAHRIGEDSILVVMATTVPASRCADNPFPTRLPWRGRDQSEAPFE